jgi:hypothetical protein
LSKNHLTTTHLTSVRQSQGEYRVWQEFTQLLLLKSVSSQRKGRTFAREEKMSTKNDGAFFFHLAAFGTLVSEVRVDMVLGLVYFPLAPCSCWTGFQHHNKSDRGLPHPVRADVIYVGALILFFELTAY